MKKNLFIIGFLTLATSMEAQVVFHVDSDGLFYVGENALVYNGGGVQTKDTGIYDVKGNVMIVGLGTDTFKTLTSLNADKVDGGNFILRMNAPASLDASTYGQLYIGGLSQGNISAVVNKEYLTRKHGDGNYFQQVSLPFYGKPFSQLSTELSKSFGTTRFTQNEILKYDNRNVVSRHYTTLSSTTFDPTGYYMLGSNANNLNVQVPPTLFPTIFPTPAGSVYTLTGKPYADTFLVGETDNLVIPIVDAGKGIIYGAGGNNLNEYREQYKSYVGDRWVSPGAGNWSTEYARNIYQFGNPFLTNIDLSFINLNEAGLLSDNNYLQQLWGIRFDPGTVITLQGGATYSTASKFVNFDSNGIPVGDIMGYTGIIKPMNTFVIKMRNNVSVDFDFKKLRRFSNVARGAAINYDVSAAKGVQLQGTVKQLGVIGLTENGEELGRTYYVVSENFSTGHTENAMNSVQISNTSNNKLGTFEENAISGGYDMNYVSKYWLYINEANETDFKGKSIPLAIYGSDIKKLKFEILENGKLVENGEHALSTGIGFFYKPSNGSVMEVKQNQTINVEADEYGLSYGASSIVLGTGNDAKPPRTMVVYNPDVENYIIQFDPQWKRADVKVYDVSGKLVISAKSVNTGSDYELRLSRQTKSVYVVEIISESGEKVSTKIIR
jgi:hypothetical protein